jgi:hypothetical protein
MIDWSAGGACRLPGGKHGDQQNGDVFVHWQIPSGPETPCVIGESAKEAAMVTYRHAKPIGRPQGSPVRGIINGDSERRSRYFEVRTLEGIRRLYSGQVSLRTSKIAVARSELLGQIDFEAIADHGLTRFSG